MRIRVFVLSVVALCLHLVAADVIAAEDLQDPIATVGHGTMLDHNGDRIAVSLSFVESAQQYYLEHLTEQLSSFQLKQLYGYRRSLSDGEASSQLDSVTRSALIIRWLIQRVPPDVAALVAAKVKTLNTRYFLDVDRIDVDTVELDYQSGLPDYLLRFGGDVPGSALRQVTNANGPNYIAECRKAGVPIPPDFKKDNWDSGEWQYNGDLDPDFLSLSPTADVYFHESKTPKGSCIALPRHDGEVVSALGVICLGLDSGNACSWDRGTTPLGEALTVNDFVGGTDLSNGTCSDCHAGENPYVIHPDSNLAIGLPLLSSPKWHDTLMKPSWPHNPGPLTILDDVPLDANDGSCLDCHNSLYGGRFPQVGELPGYCGSVLKPALAQTMPPRPASFTDAQYNDYKDTFKTHSDALEAFCKQDPPDGGIVEVDTPKEDPDYLSPPIIIEPLYACAEAIEVTSVVFGAKLEVYVDGNLVNTVVVVEPSKQAVPVPALIEGQVLSAIQIKDGVSSEKSADALVRSHKEDYPEGLPVPDIDPRLIHQCGRVIAIRHVRGARITAYVNGADPVSRQPAGDWTDVAPAIRPFNLGDEYTAEQSMCGDISPMSAAQTAVAPPAPMPVPQIINGPLLAGQELIGIENLAHGARTTVSVSGAGVVSSFSTAVSWKPEVDIGTGLGGPLSAGQQVEISSALCKSGKQIGKEVVPCDDVPSPSIQQPFVGHTSVSVTNAIAGARILVYDNNGVEIGDSSGVTIGLNRSIEPGDVLTVVQKVGECISKEGYVVSAMCLTENDGC